MDLHRIASRVAAAEEIEVTKFEYEVHQGDEHGIVIDWVLEGKLGGKEVRAGGDQENWTFDDKDDMAGWLSQHLNTLEVDGKDADQDEPIEAAIKAAILKSGDKVFEKFKEAKKKVPKWDEE